MRVLAKGKIIMDHDHQCGTETTGHVFECSIWTEAMSKIKLQHSRQSFEKRLIKFLSLFYIVRNDRSDV
jgi:hypothetical protein